MADARFDKSEKAIKEAFVRLSGEIGVGRFGMTQLAREARVSRSTLYGHFRNTEEVFEALVDDFAEGLKPLEAHLHEGCAACPTVPKPFCVAVRESVELRPLLRDPRFLPLLLDKISEEGSSLDSRGVYRSLGLGEVQARSVLLFQMSGCYAVALSDIPAEEWRCVQQELDTFIRGGMASLRTRARRAT